VLYALCFTAQQICIQMQQMVCCTSNLRDRVVERLRQFITQDTLVSVMNGFFISKATYLLDILSDSTGDEPGSETSVEKLQVKLYDWAHEGEYIIAVQMCIYDWTSYAVLNRMNAVLFSTSCCGCCRCSPKGWTAGGGGRVRAESSICGRPGCYMWCCMQHHM
jgi:hypothetical protein